jgi:hypothetical protein
MPIRGSQLICLNWAKLNRGKAEGTEGGYKSRRRPGLPMALQAPNPRFRGQDETKAPLTPISLQAQPKLAVTSQASFKFKAQSLFSHQLIHQPSMLLDQLGYSPLQDLRLGQSQFCRPVAPPH